MIEYTGFCRGKKTPEKILREFSSFLMRTNKAVFHSRVLKKSQMKLVFSLFFKEFYELFLLESSMKKLIKNMAFVGEEISDEELYELIEEADRDGDGCLNFAEFYRIMKKREDPLDDFDSDLD